MADAAAAAQKSVPARSYETQSAEPANAVSLPEALGRRHRLSPIFQRIDALSAWRGITHRALMSNLAAHSIGMEVRDGDRCVSWLPWYHDMGLVGCLLSPVANQVSTDYLKTEDFARRPLAWLDLISRNPGTTLSYSPTFGYDICARRMSSQMKGSGRFDLSRWRLAGNGADMIRPDVMQAFVDAFVEAGFQAKAFTPSYGLAEATLAVSIMPPGEGIVIELVEETELSGSATSGGSPAALSRRRQLRKARARDGDPDPRGGRHAAARSRDRQGLVPRPVGDGRLFPRSGGDRRLPGRWLAGHGRHGLHVGRLHLYRGPRQGHDHHQRQESLAPGYRVGGGAIAGLQGGRHRRLRDHHAGRRGNARRTRPVPHQRSRGALAPARRDSRARPRHHRHELRGRTGPAQDAAAHRRASSAAPRRATSICRARSSLTIWLPEPAIAGAVRRSRAHRRRTARFPPLSASRRRRPRWTAIFPVRAP
jgi:acyl-CoA synthetase (AMP-forming)/AMP-acid ligase II